MLVLSRKPGERVRIGNDINVLVVEISGKRVRIGIDAPGSVGIVREELSASSARPPDPTEGKGTGTIDPAGNP